MSLEGWKSVLEWGGVVLLALTVLFGAGALIVNNRLNARQSEQLRKVDRDLTDAKTALSKQEERAAKAELELLELKKEKLPRLLRFESQASIDAVVESLRQKPIKTDILYKRDDSEAASLAQQIWALLAGAGWPVSRPTPVPESIGADRILENLGAQPLGVSVTVKAIPDNTKRDDPYSVLTGVLVKSLGSVYGGRGPELPDNSVRIVVMPRP